MKKLLSVLLAALMIFSLTACANGPSAPESAVSSEDISSAVSVPELNEEPAAEPPVTDGQPNAPPTVEQTEVFTAEALPDITTESPELPEIDENGSYTSRDDVALYIHTYGHLPQNFITKKEAQELGWSGGSLEPYAPGKCIGGSRFGNYEGLLPEKDGRSYTECDIDTLGASSRGAKRIVFSNDGLIYYTDDHYESFTLLYGEE